MAELKPCPFCGERPVREILIDDKEYVACVNYRCPCQPATAAYKDKRVAVRMWNRRVDNGG